MRIGILGAGQLAQLLAHSAYTLGFETLCYAESSQQPATRNSPLFIGELKDNKRLQEFLSKVDLITIENENIEVETLQFLESHLPLLPNSKAIGITQDRLLEKQFFKSLNIPTTEFIAIDSLTALDSASKQLPFPALLKTRRFGYDGKGQVKLSTAHQTSSAWKTINEMPAILENFIAFDTEVSIIGARNAAKQISCYPLITNHHEQGVLRISTLSTTPHSLQQQAENHLSTVLKELDYIGVLAIEFFVKNNQLYANEMAPRVHNSGHLTLEAFSCSQFELHLRALANLPLPTLHLKQPTAMINLISKLPDNKLFLKEPNLHFYDYGKIARPYRKLGHITITNNNVQALNEKAIQIHQSVTDLK